MTLFLLPIVWLNLVASQLHLLLSVPPLCLPLLVHGVFAILNFFSYQLANLLRTSRLASRLAGGLGQIFIYLSKKGTNNRFKGNNTNRVSAGQVVVAQKNPKPKFCRGTSEKFRNIPVGHLPCLVETERQENDYSLLDSRQSDFENDNKLAKDFNHGHTGTQVYKIDNLPSRVVKYIRDIQSKMFMEMQAQKQQDKRPYSAHVKRVNKFKNDVKKGSSNDFDIPIPDGGIIPSEEMKHDKLSV